MLLQTSCMKFSMDLFSFLLAIDLGVELLGHMLTVDTWEEVPACFPRAASAHCFSTHSIKTL